MSRENIRKFMLSSFDEAKDMIKCGFELETQKIFGYDKHQMGFENHSGSTPNGVFRKKAYLRAIQNAVTKKCNEIILPFLCISEIKKILINLYKENTGLDTPRLPELKEWIKKSFIVSEGRGISLNYLQSNGHITYALYEEAKNLIATKVRISKDRYLQSVRVRNPDEFLNELIDGWDSNLFNHENDGTVGGREIISRGACDYDGFKKRCEILFNENNKYTIDEKCSFHIHISLDGVKHSFGANFQSYIYEYLLSNMDKIPEDVKYRWFHTDNDWRQRYWNFAIQNQKYCFVAFRGTDGEKKTVGTWEFRCFGNVKNFKDAMQCLDIAIQAMQYAYRCKEGYYIPLFKKAYQNTREIYDSALFHDDPKAELEKHAENQNNFRELTREDDLPVV